MMRLNTKSDFLGGIWELGQRGVTGNSGGHVKGKHIIYKILYKAIFVCFNRINSRHGTQNYTVRAIEIKQD